MNVGMLVWTYWPCPVGGAERQCRKIVSALTRQGIDCEILTSWSSPLLKTVEYDGSAVIRRFGLFCPMISVAGVLRDKFYKIAAWLSGPFVASAEREVEFERRFKMFEFWFMLPFVWLGRLSFIYGVKRYLSRQNHGVNILHVHEASWIAGLGAWLGGHSGIPVVCKEATYPSLPVIGFDVPFRHFWERQRIKSWYIAMNSNITQSLVSRGIDLKRIFMVSNGVEIPSICANTTANKEVLYVGNFSQGVEWKAFDVLFAAWVQIHKRIPEARLTVVGGGDSSSWRSFMDHAGCAESVCFAGRVPDPGCYYERSAFLVLPSRVEGMSNVLLEALSWGLPAVVSDIPGNTALIQDGVNGIVVPVGNAELLCDGIIRLLTDIESRKRMGNAARMRMEKEFSMDIVSKKLVEIYKGLMSGAGC